MLQFKTELILNLYLFKINKSSKSNGLLDFYTIMKIETKYNIGDTVWTISENKVKSGKITQPYTFTPYTVNFKYDLTKLIGWKLDKLEWKTDSERPIVRLEEELFLTKEELIQSLSDPDEPLFDLRNDE